MTQSHKQAFGKTDALLLLMALIWGVNFSVVKFATTVFSPLAFTGLRVFLAAVALLAVSATRSKPWPV
ncbi:MAG: EamA family transporter, partial [Gemmatimonadaceae bacterium]